MSRNWLFLRLPGPPGTKHGEHPARVISAVAPELVRYLRSADPEGRWFFQRLIDGHGPGVGLWFHSTGPVRRELERRLRRESARRDWPLVVERYQPPAAKYRSGHTLRLAERLATASSDLAMELLRAGGLRPGTHLEAATLHLRHLLELVATADRPAFLFHCWDHWTRGMRPARRVQLAAQADLHAPAIPDAPVAPGGTDPWEGYRRAMHAAITERQPGAPGEPAPVNYLLFDHAHLTHHRLGIAGATEACAARALRTALSAGLPRLPLAAAGRTPTLQSA